MILIRRRRAGVLIGLPEVNICRVSSLAHGCFARINFRHLVRAGTRNYVRARRKTDPSNRAATGCVCFWASVYFRCSMRHAQERIERTLGSVSVQRSSQLPVGSPSYVLLKSRNPFLKARWLSRCFPSPTVFPKTFTQYKCVPVRYLINVVTCMLVLIFSSLVWTSLHV